MSVSALQVAAPPLAQAKFKAFLSYKHEDRRWRRWPLRWSRETWGQWLQRRLESYHVPKELVGQLTSTGPIPSRLKPVFRDRSDLAAGGELDQKVCAALRDSAFLIVICSPRSAKSDYVNKEIKAFRQTHTDDRILPLIVEGEPNASSTAQECLPCALRFQREPDELASGTSAELLCADARPGHDGPRMATLKVIAGILGLGLDDLVARDAERRRRQAVTWMLGAMLVGVVMTVLTVLAIRSRWEAEHQRNVASENFKVAVNEEARATKEYGKAKATKEFLQSIFATADLRRVGAKRDISLRDAVEMAATQPKDQDYPLETLISIRGALGKVYVGLGLYAKANTEFAAALANFKNVTKPDAALEEEIADLLEERGYALWMDQGSLQQDACNEFYNEAIRIHSEHHSPMALRALAMMAHTSGDDAVAERFLDACLRVVWGKWPDGDITSDKDRLLDSLRRAWRQQDHRQVVALIQTLVNKLPAGDIPATRQWAELRAYIPLDLAVFAKQQVRKHDYDVAEAFCYAADQLAAHWTTDDPKWPMLLQIEARDILVPMQRWQAAADKLALAAERASGALGENHPTMINLRATQAGVYRHLGREEEAAALESRLHTLATAARAGQPPLAQYIDAQLVLARDIAATNDIGNDEP